MNKIQDLAKRKRLRLQNYDYDSHGAYFLTICTHQRKPILSKIAPATVGNGTILKTKSKPFGLLFY